jgi:WD40 repeat protein
MKKNLPPIHLLFFLLVLTLLVSACGTKATPAGGEAPTAAEQEAQAPAPTEETQPTPTQGPTNTRTPRPTATATLPPTETLVPSPTVTPTDAPTATPTVTPVIPISQGTPLPQPPLRLAFDNASLLRELAEYGQKRPWEVRLSAGATHLFVANGKGIDVYDAASTELLTTIADYANCEISMAGAVHTILPSSDGQSVVICGAGELRRYALDGQLIWSLPLPVSQKTTVGKPQPTKLVISPDLKYVVLPAVGGKSEIWDPAQNQVLLTELGVNPVFSPDGSRMGLDFNGNVWLYNTQDWSKTKSIVISQGETKLFLPGGERLAVLGASQLEIFLLAAGKLERTFFEYSGGSSTSLFFSPDGLKVAWSGKEYPDKPLNVWGIVEGKQTGTLRRTDSIYSVWPQEFTHLSDDGRATVNEYAEALQKQVESPYLSPGYLSCILVNGSETPCGTNYLNTVYDLNGRPIRLFRSVPNTPYQVFNGSGANESLLGSVSLPAGRVYTVVSISPNQRYLLTTSQIDERNISWVNFRTELWNLQTGAAVVNMLGRVQTVTFSQDGRYGAFMVGTYTGTTVKRLTLTVFDFVERRVVFQPGIPAPTGYEPTGMAFLPQGSFVYAQQTSRDGKDLIVLKILDIEKWQVRREIEIADFGELTPKTMNRLPAMAASPDGKILAVALADNRVRLFDLASDTEINTWAPHSSQTTFLQFSPNGYVLGSLSSEDGLIKAWGVWP